MNRPLLRFAILVVLFALFALATGCRKKTDDADLAEEAEKALPPPEQVAKEEPPAAPASVPPATDGTAGNADFEAWFKKHKLNLNDPKMLDADPDGDGFSNRDEFLADTDPNDQNSLPGQHPQIRLKEFNEVRLPIVVEAVEGGKARIRRTDENGKAESVKVGDTIRGLQLTVQRVEQISDTDKEGHPIDRSIVVLEDPGSKERLTLVKDMQARTAASFAILTGPNGETVKVKQDDTFQWPGATEVSYKVIDLREDQVVLQQLDNKKMWTVPHATKPPGALAPQ